MASTDRKKKEPKAKPETALQPINFTLPESLSVTEMKFPTLIQRRRKVKWETILNEQAQWMQEIEEYENRNKKKPIRSIFQYTEGEYIRKKIFPFLIPALIETVEKAKIWEALINQKCFFNGIDHIAQLIYNGNPRFPERNERKLHYFNMPWVRELFKKYPRAYYPKSWLWPEEYAATMIQKTVRQYFVQRDPEVQEMRDFWKKLEMERANPDIHLNPFLSEVFAKSKFE